MEGHYGIVGQGGLIPIMKTIMRLDTAKYICKFANYISLLNKLKLQMKHFAFQKCKRERVNKCSVHITYLVG